MTNITPHLIVRRIMRGGLKINQRLVGSLASAVFSRTPSARIWWSAVTWICILQFHQPAA
jgi:hypothetical protein